MILVDTSVWISLFGKKSKFVLKDEQLPLLATCPPIIQEVLQGIGNDFTHHELKQSFLSMHTVSNPISVELYLKASDIYRLGRKKGFTIRSSIDCLIAAIAMNHQIPIWHIDRDFDKISDFTELQIFDPKFIK